MVDLKVGYKQNQNQKAVTKNQEPRHLISDLGLRNFQIPGRHSFIGFTILDIIG
jgi:hypothetical protein